jgi:hypothetical protein
MSLLNDSAPDAEPSTDPQAEHQLYEIPDFQFLPRELVGKCYTLAASYHAIEGYGILPDILWNSEARAVIEHHGALSQIFRNASKTRQAKRANEGFLLIATVIVSVEVLARDFAGWGKRFPQARSKAEAFLIDFPQRERSWFMDHYLYPSLTTNRHDTLKPSPAEMSLSSD